MRTKGPTAGSGIEDDAQIAKARRLRKRAAMIPISTGRPTCFSRASISCLLAMLSACAVGADDDETRHQQSGLTSCTTTESYLPTRDAARSNVYGTNDTTLFASVDDGTSFAASDNDATLVRNVWASATASYMAGFTGGATGVSQVTVNVRARADSGIGGSVRLEIFDGATLLGTGPSHALTASWTNLTDSFSGFALSRVDNLRVRVSFSRAASGGYVYASSLWVDTVAHAAASDGGTDAANPDVGPAGVCTIPTDQVTHSIPTLSKPGYLQSAIDPTFQQKIVRVTGNPGTTVPTVGGSWGNRERHHYSLDQAWNADMSLLYLEERGGGTQLFLDGRTYQVKFAIAEQGGDAARWHPTDPNRMIYVGDHDIQSLDVRTQVRTTIASFAGYSGFRIGPYKGNLSTNGNRLAINATTSSGRAVIFAYDMATKTKFPDIDVTAEAVSSSSISPKGDFIVTYGTDERTKIRRLDGSLHATWPEAAVPDHYDLTIDTDGQQIAVGSARNSQYKGGIVKRRLSDGVVTALTNGGYGSHSSTRCTGRPGWAYVSFFETSAYPPYSAEIAAVKLDGSKTVERFVHHRSTESTYYAQSQPSPSPDGSRVIFASDWGNAGGPIQGYVVELPGVASGACR